MITDTMALNVLYINYCMVKGTSDSPNMILANKIPICPIFCLLKGGYNLAPARGV